MKIKQSFKYLLIEDSYLICKSITRMLTSLRPAWSQVGVCDSTMKIKDWIPSNPDFIFADSHLSDGRSIEPLRLHASKLPVVLYTHLIDEDEARSSLENIVKFIYEPISHEEMQEAVNLLEIASQTPV